MEAEFAATDLLTGLPNAMGFESSLASSVRAALKRRDPLSLLIFEIMDYQDIVRGKGTITSENMLGAVGHIWRGALRGSDTLSRIDEARFAAILHGAATTDACQVADDLRRAVEHHVFVLEGMEVNCKVNIGVAGILPDDQDESGILDRALQALAQAQEEGGVCCALGL